MDRSAVYVSCEVPGCTEGFYCGWMPEENVRGIKTCRTHLMRHYDKDDEFNFYEVLKIPKPSPTEKKRWVKKEGAHKSSKQKKGAIDDKVVALFKPGATMQTREVETLLNKDLTDDVMSIHSVRGAIRKLLSDQRLVVVGVVSKQFVLGLPGTTVEKPKQSKQSKQSKKSK